MPKKINPLEIRAALPGGDTLVDGSAHQPKETSKERIRTRRLAFDEPIVTGVEDLGRMLNELGIDDINIDTMSNPEKAYLRKYLDDLRDTGTSEMVKKLIEADYRWEPVSMQQFLEDPYYLGGSTKELFPKCKEMLVSIFDQNRPPLEVILGGAIGWGKTTAAAVGMVYDMYKMGCLRNPHEFYGIMGGAKIVFALYSVSKDQAADSAFSKIISWMDTSPYFREKMPRVGNHTTRALFRNCPILLITGSQEIHSIGKDMFSFLMDEANFLTAKGGDDEQSRANAIYVNAKDRLRSRFMDNEGEIPGKMWLISSKRTHASFLESHIAESKDKGDISEGRTMLFEYSQWAVRDPARFKKPKFRVEVGDRIYPSKILAPGEDARPGAEVIEVPGEYREPFEKDIDSGLRNMAGIATVSMCPLFRDRSLIDKCITDELVHPFTRPEIVTNILDDVGIETYFRPEVLFATKMSKYVVRRNPDAPRFVHVDVGFTQDAMGIACVHQQGWKMVRRLRNDGTYYEDRAPLIVTDFVLRITPPRGSEIDLAKMRAFLIGLRDYGLPIHRVTLDGHQGRDTMQILRKIDFDAVLYSVDKTDEAYMTLRQCVTEDRIKYYNYATLLRELGELERDIEEGTVNHPKKSPATGGPGSKDVSDALAGATFQCMIDLKAAVGGLSQTPQAATVASARTPGGALPWNVLDREATR